MKRTFRCGRLLALCTALLFSIGLSSCESCSRQKEKEKTNGDRTDSLALEKELDKRSDQLNDSAWAQNADTLQKFINASDSVMQKEGENGCPMLKQRAVFSEGYEGMVHYIQNNLHYPKTVNKDTISGTIIVRFEVESSGDIRNVQLVKGLHPDLNREVIRVIKEMPPFEPAIDMNDEPIKSSYILPIKFAQKQK